jgi:hypothetical protein
MTTSEIGAMIDAYSDGDCLVLAFAIHWMCGWPVMAVSEPGGADHLHFAARGPDGLAWDARGPRTFAAAGADYADDPRWEEVEALRFIATHPSVDEDAITRACDDAVTIMGESLSKHIVRLPDRGEAA